MIGGSQIFRSTPLAWAELLETESLPPTLSEIEVVAVVAVVAVRAAVDPDGAPPVRVLSTPGLSMVPDWVRSFPTSLVPTEEVVVLINDFAVVVEMLTVIDAPAAVVLVLVSVTVKLETEMELVVVTVLPVVMAGDVSDMASVVVSVPGVEVGVMLVVVVVVVAVVAVVVVVVVPQLNATFPDLLSPALIDATTAALVSYGTNRTETFRSRLQLYSTPSSNKS
jgi:hypothetical protein